MKIIKKILTILMITILLISITYVSANDNNETNKFNIEVVVDASGSLKKTDADNNRFTAIDIFLQSLSNNGNNVGAVVFTEQIMIDTDLIKMTSNNDRNNLSNQISSISADKGDTNIGLALEKAVERLENKDNGLNNVILLISDGNSDLDNKGDLDISLDKKEKAVQNCITNNIPIYGICLNSNGQADLNEFIDISQRTSGAFLEVKSSDGLVKALRDFYAQIFKTKAIEDSGVIDSNGYLKKAIAVPSFGVEELNITIDNASKISSIILTKPDGITMTATELEGVSSTIGDYRFIKLMKPDSGTWNLELYGEQNTQIEFAYIYNSNYQAKLISDSPNDSYSVGEEVKLLAYFEEDDIQIVGKDYYQDYSATLVLNFLDGKNENKQYYAMKPNDIDGFATELVYNEIGNYTAYAVLNCGDFEIQTNTITFSVGNSVPVLKKDTLHIKKLFSNSKSINLNDFFSDKEDTKLKYSLIASTYKDKNIKLDGNTLTLTDLEDGSITIQAIDSQGATVNGVIHVEVQNLLFVILIILGLILMFCMIIFAKIRHTKINKMFIGVLSIYANSSYVDDIESLPAQNFKGKKYLRDFCLHNTDFSPDAYFEVIKDTTSKLPKGNFSKKLKFVSPKEFYFIDGGQERKAKTLELSMNMDYVLCSHSRDDVNGNDDSIKISLSEE